MFYIIYKLTNKQNNKFYIGITSESLQHRFNEHVRKARFKSTANLHQAINKYGAEAFSKEIIHSFECADKKDAYAIEQDFITKLNAVALGYNMDIGYGWNIACRKGSNNPMYGKVSGNAHKTVVKDIEYPSVSAAASALGLDRATIQRWVKSDKHTDCFKV